MDDEYKTLEKQAEGMYREKGSRFLAFGYRVLTEDSAREIIASLKKKHHKARHYCYAYRLGMQEESCRMNDDGEPSGTAGKSIYNILLSMKMTNVLIVVVRYFGGILLGKNKLANAYKNAVLEMLSNARIITCHIEKAYRIKFPYRQLNDVMKIIKEENITPVQPLFENTCSFFINVRKSHSLGILRRLEGIEGLIYESTNQIHNNCCTVKSESN